MENSSQRVAGGDVELGYHSLRGDEGERGPEVILSNARGIRALLNFGHAVGHAIEGGFGLSGVSPW